MMTTEEDLFSPLAADKGIADNWYAARQYVQAMLGKWEEDSPSHHYVFGGSSDLLLSVARQLALVSHYIDFDETTGLNRTVLSFTGVPDAGALIEKLGRKEFLSNLAKYCKITVVRKGACEVVGPYLPYLDIEINIFEACSPESTEGCICIDDEMLGAYLNENSVKQSIDVRKAKWVNMVYSVGSTLNNLPPDDPNTADRYKYALNVFCYQTDEKMLEDGWNSISQVERKLSNVFCADCFESNVREVQGAVMDKSLLTGLAKCEHARWNVEKLVTGFRPLSNEEKYEDEMLLGKDRKMYRAALKNKVEDPAHIDLCSYAELKRVNPEDMKYDCFLMLAMPFILNSCR